MQVQNHRHETSPIGDRLLIDVPEQRKFGQNCQCWNSPCRNLHKHKICEVQCVHHMLTITHEEHQVRTLHRPRQYTNEIFHIFSFQLCAIFLPARSCSFISVMDVKPDNPETSVMASPGARPFIRLLEMMVDMTTVIC